MKYYTTQQAAYELCVTTRTLERWRSEGRFLPEVRTIGGHSRYSHKQISSVKNGTIVIPSRLPSKKSKVDELLG